MNTGHTVTIAPSPDHIEVRIDATVVAESDRAAQLDETGLPRRYYLPKDDVRMDLLRPTSFHTSCPFKGEASYWSVDVESTSHDGVVWGYEEPLESASAIAGLVSFDSERAEIIVG